MQVDKQTYGVNGVMIRPVTPTVMWNGAPIGLVLRVMSGLNKED